MEIPTPAPRPRGRPRVPEEDQWVNKMTYSNPVKRIRWCHDLAIDMLIENPHWIQKDLAQYFGYTEAFISRLMLSDAFQAKLSERRNEILSPEVRLSIEQRFQALATHSLNRLHEKLENPNASDGLVLRSVELAAKALGLGARPAPAMSMQVAIVVPPKATQTQEVVYDSAE